MKHKTLYYLIHDRHPFLVIMKQTEEGWYVGDTARDGLLTVFYHKSKPRLHDETYSLVTEYMTARQFLDYQMREVKQDLMDNFYLNRDANYYLDNLKNYNRELSMRYYLHPDGSLIYLRTILYKNRSWRQEIGILGEKKARRTWHDNDLGSEEPMLWPSSKMIPISYDDARKRGENFIDILIAERIETIEKFCEVG